MNAYYNEIDPYCCEWLKALMAENLIPAGIVDSRPIQRVEPKDLDGFSQCHFFAGLGGWAYAARLAGWPDDRELWTGSCPCQPFSLAGKQQGFDDPRHLWPDFFRLIRARRPACVMGEQVASAPGYAWLDGMGADLDREDYSWRAVDIPACSVNALQIRNRLYWIASSAGGAGRERHKSHYRIPLTARKAPAVLSHHFADARRALEGDFRNLLSGDGISLQVERDRARCYGNAIIPEEAAEVIAAWMEVSA